MVPDGAFRRRLKDEVSLDMRKISTLEHAAKVIALCLPPVVMSLIGLALSRKQPRGRAAAGGQSRRAKPSTPPTDAG